MAPVPPSPRRRKVRLVRAEVPDDALLVVRATGADPEASVRSIAEDAQVSGEVYVIDLLGTREVLYGVSVFAHREGIDVLEVLARFPGAPRYLETTAGTLRRSGFGVHATGSNPDHYDVQLLPGCGEEVPAPMHEDLLLAAQRLLDVAGESRPNPSYAGPEPGEQE